MCLICGKKDGGAVREINESVAGKMNPLLTLHEIRDILLCMLAISVINIVYV